MRVWQKVGFAPHPYFHVFPNVFTDFVEYNIGVAKSLLCATPAKPVTTGVTWGFGKGKNIMQEELLINISKQLETLIEMLSKEQKKEPAKVGRQIGRAHV